MTNDSHPPLLAKLLAHVAHFVPDAILTHGMSVDTDHCGLRFALLGTHAHGLYAVMADCHGQLPVRHFATREAFLAFVDAAPVANPGDKDVQRQLREALHKVWPPLTVDA